MKNLLAAAAAVAISLGIDPALATDSPAFGLWVMANGKVTINVSACGDQLCGTLAALKEPLDKHGKPKRDVKNPDPAKRDRPVIGINLLTLKATGPNQWRGTIYNADDGHLYKSSVSLAGDTMNVKGCFLIFCKSLAFNRMK